MLAWTLCVGADTFGTWVAALTWNFSVRRRPDGSTVETVLFQGAETKGPALLTPPNGDAPGLIPGHRRR